ncbi:MAG: adenosylmethionine decarboxylase [Candidatus Heimdallarchaeota archaeon]|nr:MAG: adenosylmethionine decarboxylase [Candidatus Heimdallarchaeota archaeon]
MFGDPQSFFRTIAEKSHLKEGEKGVERIVVEIYRYQNQKMTNKELSRNVRIPVPVLSAVRGELLGVGFLKTKSILSPAAIEWIHKKLGLKYSSEFFQDFISDSTFSISKRYIDFFKPVIDYLNLRPHPEYKYDQSRSTSESVIKRALLMLKNGDVEGKRIAILGDDDGVSLALAFLKCAKDIFVIDIDSRVLEFINSFAREKNLTNVLNTHLWDIRNTFPKRWRHRFDTFETDPPYTVAGFKLFVNQALNLLDPIKGGSGYISFGVKSPHDTWVCQQHLLEAGFSIEEFIHGFNRYHGASILGNTSNLYVISSVPQKLRLYETKHPKTAIYTFDEKKTKDLPTIGYQIIAEFYGVNSTFLKEPEPLTNVLKQGIEKSQLHMEEIFVKEYSPHGLSIIAILVESHCHLHTWPEWDYLSLDIFVCEASEKAEKLFQYLLKEINPMDYHKFQFFRGRPPVLE